VNDFLGAPVQAPDARRPALLAGVTTFSDAGFVLPAVFFGIAAFLSAVFAGAAVFPATFFPATFFAATFFAGAFAAVFFAASDMMSITAHAGA
jgi:hypothetical protein